MIIQSIAAAWEAQRALMKEQRIVVDTETDGLDAWGGNNVIGIAFHAPEANKSWYLPLLHDLSNSPDLFNFHYPDLNDVWEGLIKDREVIYFNALFDMHMMQESLGLRAPDTISDVRLAAHLYNENEALTNTDRDPLMQGYAPVKAGAYALKRLASVYLGADATAEEEEMFRVGKELGLNPKTQMKHMPLQVVAKYAEQDVKITWNLYQFYCNKLQDDNRLRLFHRRNRFVRRVLYPMEQRGIAVDEATIQTHRAAVREEMESIRQRLDEISRDAGVNRMFGFNPSSPSQVKTLLRLQGTSVPDTSSEQLHSLMDNEAAQLTLKFRSLQKAERTYYRRYLEMARKGRIHPSFNPIGTVAGRISCTRPNLQQIPRVSDNYRIKEIFVASEGYQLVEIDYSMLELRLAAHVCDETIMKEMLHQKQDVHQFTADNLGISRYQGKVANFALLYGMGPAKASRLLQTSEEEAWRIIRDWHSLFPCFKQGYEAAQRKAARGDKGHEFIEVAEGRRRHYGTYWDRPFWKDRWKKYPPPFHTAFNTLIQGAAAAILENALLKLDLVRDRLGLDFHMLVCVHDSVILEVAEEDLPRVIANARVCMEDSNNLTVPLEVNVKTGYNLAHMVEIT